MTPEQKDLIVVTFEQLRPLSETVGALFYGRLFELNPDLQPLFRGPLRLQSEKLMAMLGSAVQSLAEPQLLEAELQALGARHVDYGVQPEDYETVAEAFLWTIEMVLGELYTPAVHEAWLMAYAWLAATMQPGL